MTKNKINGKFIWRGRIVPIFPNLKGINWLKGKATNQADIDYLNNQIEYLELKSTNSFAAQRLLRNKRKQAKIDQEAGKTLTRYQKQILGLD